MSKKEKETPILADEVLGKSEAFVIKYKVVIIVAIIAIVVCVLGFLAYSNYVSEPKENAAQETIFYAQESFNNGDFETALNGDGTHLGFLAFIEKNSGTDAANIAEAYAGICYAQLGNYDEAIKHLEAYNGEDQIIAPQMKHALGNCYSHKNNYEKAISLLLEAADEANNPAVTPYCWFDVAAMYVEQGKKAEAVELYAKIKQEYPNTPVAEQAEIKLNSMK